MTQRYDTYKDSGVQWLGEIPGHWGCVPLKYFIETKSGTAINVKELDDRGTYPVYGGGSQIGFCNKYNCEETEIIVGRVGAKCGCVTFPNKKVWATDNALIIKTNLYQRFTAFVLIAADLNRLNAANAQPLITGTKIKHVRIALPPLSEQRSIVSFLDDKCGKIDEWVTKKQKEVEHLQELKQRVIADAVTRGLNPHVKMKATNIPWLKEIPEHWEMSKISSHFRQRNEKVSDKDYPALSVSKQGVTPQLDNVALSNAEGTSRKLVKVGDYAVNSRSDRKGSCGVSKYEGSVSLITIVLEPFNINGEYIHYLFRSNLWVEEFYRNGRGIVADLWTTNYQMMKSMYMPVPPLSEQKQIVSYLDTKTSQIDKLIAHITKEIECIKEYKQRLISDVVTGQIKVC